MTLPVPIARRLLESGPLESPADSSEMAISAGQYMPVGGTPRPKTVRGGIQSLNPMNTRTVVSPIEALESSENIVDRLLRRQQEGGDRFLPGGAGPSTMANLRDVDTIREMLRSGVGRSGVA